MQMPETELDEDAGQLAVARRLITCADYSIQKRGDGMLSRCEEWAYTHFDFYVSLIYSDKACKAIQGKFR